MHLAGYAPALVFPDLLKIGKKRPELPAGCLEGLFHALSFGHFLPQELHVRGKLLGSLDHHVFELLPVHGEGLLRVFPFGDVARDENGARDFAVQTYGPQVAFVPEGVVARSPGAHLEHHGATRLQGHLHVPP